MTVCALVYWNIKKLAMPQTFRKNRTQEAVNSVCRFYWEPPMFTLFDIRFGLKHSL